MIPKNPDIEAIDTRPLSVKVEEEENVKIKPSNQNSTPDSDETDMYPDGKGNDVEVDTDWDKAESAGSMNELLTELDRIQVRTMEDLNRIKALVCKMEGK